MNECSTFLKTFKEQCYGDVLLRTVKVCRNMISAMYFAE